MTAASTLVDTDPSPSLDDLFSDIKPALSHRQAVIESARCYYCYDAPCVKACPSDIDIPSFIASIHHEDVNGAAETIYEQNIMGGSCARVCPTEILCEQACVRNKEEECAPVLIGLLQRHATDNAVFPDHPIGRASSTGKKVAVVGAGPAGLSCAHRLAVLGNEVDVFEAQSKAGGLNEYGIAKYKLTNQFAQKEVDFILGVGGITIHYNKALGKEIHLTDLTERYDSVFLGIGLQDTRELGLANESSIGVLNAVDFIKELRQANDIDQLDVPRTSAVVIGAGNTAIDIACQLKRLGTEEVTLVYRRGEADMSATDHEQHIAKEHQVRIKTWARPVEIRADANNHVSAVRFAKTRIDNGKLMDTGEFFEVACEAVYKAVGQSLAYPADETQLPDIGGGKISTMDNFKTTISKVFAGGDCTGVGQDLTVEAVQQGKLAAMAIHNYLTGSEGN